jgi:hypothetical protein
VQVSADPKVSFFKKNEIVRLQQRIVVMQTRCKRLQCVPGDACVRNAGKGICVTGLGEATCKTAAAQKMSKTAIALQMVLLCSS